MRVALIEAAPTTRLRDIGRRMARLESGRDVAGERGEHGVHAEAALARDDELLQVALLLHPVPRQARDRGRGIVPTPVNT